MPATVSRNTWRFDSINNPVWNNMLSLEGKARSSMEKDEQTLFSFTSKMPAARAQTPDDQLTIELTEHEIKIFDFLLEMNRHFGLKTVLRVAGGWVRNKLMGLPGKDIDIALDDMMGTQYAEYVQKFEEEKGMPTRSFGVIKANPDQSKHLESVSTHIYDEPIDFVNLRSEDYAEDSRIPTIQVGTPQQDAFRRDLTINSLFYNLNTRKIEDLTGHGISDLRLGIVRTPLPPLQTFLDDPLRVLRAVRFACSLNFVVDDDIVSASHDTRVHRALEDKVSRERFGIEMGKILAGPDPVGGFALINALNIRNVIFSISGFGSSQNSKTNKRNRLYENPVPIKWTPDEWDNTLFRMRCLLQHARRTSGFTEHDQQTLMLAAALSTTLTTTTTYEHILDLSDNLIMTSLKLPNKLTVDTATVIFGAFRIASLVEKASPERNIEQIRAIYRRELRQQITTVGTWIRDVKKLYPLATALASLVHTVGTEFTGEASRSFVQDQQTGQFLLRGEILASVIAEMQIDAKIIDMKPLLNGNEIAQTLNIKPGPGLKPHIDALLAWQMERFDQNVSKDDAAQWLQIRKQANGQTV